MRDPGTIWLGASRDQIVGHTIAEVIGPECLRGMLPRVEAALAGRPMDRDAQVVHKRLGPRWIHVDSVPTFDSSGAPDDSSPFFMGLVELEGDSIVFLSANQALAGALGTTSERMGGEQATEFASLLGALDAIPSAEPAGLGA